MPTPDGSIGSRDLCTGAAVERVIADGGVTSLKISATLQSDNFASGSAGWQINRATGSAEFQDAVIRGTLNAADITTGYIDAAVIDVRNLNATELKSGQVSADRIATTSLNADNITSGTLSADYISGGTVSADILYGGTISGGDVSITNLNASNITSGVITAPYISVSNLSALSGDTGNLTITGTLVMNGSGGIKTASGGARIEIGGGVATAAQNIDFYDTTGSSGSLSASSSGTNWLAVEFDLVTFEPTGGGAYRLSIGSSLSQFNHDVRINGGDDLRFQSAGSRINGEGGDWYLARAGSNKLTIDGSGISIGGRLDVSSYVYTTGILTAVSGSAGQPCWTWNGDGTTGIYRITGGYFAATTNGSIAMQWGPGANKFIYGLQTGTTNAMHYNSSSGQITYVSSTRRIKKNEEEFAEVGLTDLLRPKTFEMRQEGEEASELNLEGDVTNGTKRRLGLIAEDVTEAIPLAGIFMPDDPVPMNYEDRAVLAAVILDLQDTRRRLEALEGAAV